MILVDDGITHIIHFILFGYNGDIKNGNVEGSFLSLSTHCSIITTPTTAGGIGGGGRGYNSSKDKTWWTVIVYLCGLLPVSQVDIFKTSTSNPGCTCMKFNARNSLTIGLENWPMTGSLVDKCYLSNEIFQIDPQFEFAITSH